MCDKTCEEGMTRMCDRTREECEEGMTRTCDKTCEEGKEVVDNAINIQARSPHRK